MSHLLVHTPSDVSGFDKHTTRHSSPWKMAQLWLRRRQPTVDQLRKCFVTPTNPRRFSDTIPKIDLYSPFLLHHIIRYMNCSSGGDVAMGNSQTPRLKTGKGCGTSWDTFLDETNLQASTSPAKMDEVYFHPGFLFTRLTALQLQFLNSKGSKWVPCWKLLRPHWLSIGAKGQSLWPA